MDMFKNLRLLFDTHVLGIVRVTRIKSALMDNFGISANDVQKRIVEHTWTAEYNMKTKEQIKQEIEKLKKRKAKALLKQSTVHDATDYLILVNRIATLQWVIDYGHPVKESKPCPVCGSGDWSCGH